MLLNFSLLSLIVIISFTSANPVDKSPQSPSNTISYSTDLVVQENPFPLLVQMLGSLTGYQRSALLTAAGIISWVATNYSTIISVASAVMKFCRLTNQCMGLEQYVPMVRISSMVTPERLETAERFLITAKRKYL